MKVLDIVHSFHDGKTRVSRGLCRVRSFVSQSGTAVLLTDLGNKNNGQSVTNAVEMVIGSLLSQGLVLEPATFIEHYERSDPQSDTFDRVLLHPRTEWLSLSRDQARAILGCNRTELDDRSVLNQRILERADSLRFQKNPFVDSRFSDSNEVILRKLEISTGMISKVSVDTLIQSGAGEQEIQRLLKTDLSIFGEAYAMPDDEYICFSEYPVADGSVDFVVLTGRSRMDVILIEVKGRISIFLTRITTKSLIIKFLRRRAK
nr:Shedu anti-phage system protein SduA domain-containing protein [uncultured Cupriavidus sp.]